jgi:hypothetical protein
VRHRASPRVAASASEPSNSNSLFDLTFRRTVGESLSAVKRARNPLRTRAIFASASEFELCDARRLCEDSAAENRVSFRP